MDIRRIATDAVAKELSLKSQLALGQAMVAPQYEAMTPEQIEATQKRMVEERIAWKERAIKRQVGNLALELLKYGAEPDVAFEKAMTLVGKLAENDMIDF